MDAIQVGDIGVRVIDDGGWDYGLDFVFPQVPEAEAVAELGDRLGPDGRLHLSYQCLLLTTSSGLVLVDTGDGPSEGATSTPLLDGLAAAGVAPDDIGTVVLTHAHPDHIGGLLREGAPVFSRARHVITEAEWGTWMSHEAAATLPDYLVGPAQAVLPHVGFERVASDAEIVPGVRLQHAPGHTPGHVAVEVRSGADEALFLADAVLDDLSFVHPEWTSVPDLVPEESVATRRRLLDRAAADEVLVLAYHVPGAGRVERRGGGYRLVR